MAMLFLNLNCLSPFLSDGEYMLSRELSRVFRKKMEALRAALWLNGDAEIEEEIDPILEAKAEIVQTTGETAVRQYKDWEQQLASQSDFLAAEGWQHFLALKIEKETAMKVQWRNQQGDHMHMAKALKKKGFIQQSQYYFSLNSDVVHGVFSFSKEAVSHPSYVHGGAQFFVMDECCGQLAFLILRGGALTAQSEIKFMKPFPTNSKCIVVAEVEKIEGRKAFLRGTLRESPSGPIYAQFKALYVKAPEKLLQSCL